MSFTWTDRRGQRHELDSASLIEAEAEAISVEHDRLVGLMENPDRAIRDSARKLADAHQLRLDQLLADIQRWNAHATAVLQAQAVKLAGAIEQLPEGLGNAMLVAALHDEDQALLEATAGAPEARAQVLAGPVTSAQRRAIAACASRTPLPEGSTRAQASAWLGQQEKFARSPHADSGWFAWTDRHGHAHRLIDPLLIELEAAGLARELSALRAALDPSADVMALNRAILRGLASWERLGVLEKDLGRFEREEDARDLAECKAYAADWRSKRSK